MQRLHDRSCQLDQSIPVLAGQCDEVGLGVPGGITLDVEPKARADQDTSMDESRGQCSSAHFFRHLQVASKM